MAPEFIDEMRDRYGENSSAFMVRVMGEFPLADDDTIIPFHLVEAAQHRDIEESRDAYGVGIGCGQVWRINGFMQA